MLHVKCLSYALEGSHITAARGLKKEFASVFVQMFKYLCNNLKGNVGTEAVMI